jgi:hypothetical protein
MDIGESSPMGLKQGSAGSKAENGCSGGKPFMSGTFADGRMTVWPAVTVDQCTHPAVFAVHLDPAHNA